MRKENIVVWKVTNILVDLVYSNTVYFLVNEGGVYNSRHKRFSKIQYSTCEMYFFSAV